MMYKRLGEANNLCVLRVSRQVLAIDGAVITDQNAASDYVRFLAPGQWQALDFDAIFAMDWRHPDNPPAYFRHKAQKCAEVLVPQRVELQYLAGAYVVDQAAAVRLAAAGFTLPIAVNSMLFFR
jgi:hypothetical protein